MFKHLSTDSPDPRLAGVFGPVVTNFSADGETLHIPAFSANILAHLASGCGGVLVAGSTGEAALLDEGERMALTDAARTVVPGSGVLLVGIGAESTRLVIRRARDCSAAGADGVLVVSPHYYTAAMTRDALRRHFLAVADASPVPVLLYNIPKYAHLVLDPELVAELAAHQNIIGIKDSSGDPELLRGYLDIQKSANFTVLTGHGPSFQEALRLGARGGILAVSLFTGDVTPRQFAAFRGGDESAAAELQQLHQSAGREIVGALGVAGVKGALDLVGLHGGPVRAPLLPLSETGRAHLHAFLPRVAAAS